VPQPRRASSRVYNEGVRLGLDMVLRRAPRPALRPFIETLWATDERAASGSVVARREHVLPTGRMHLAIRLSDDPLRLFDDAGDHAGRLVSEAVVGGARDSFYIRDVSRPLCSVGAVLRPGAADALFGVPAHELAGQHTPLDALWGRPVASMRDRLAEIRSLDERLDAFEAVLASRLPRARGLHPAIAQALEQLLIAPAVATDHTEERGSSLAVRDVVKQSGYSHRTFLSLFHRAVGLTPKVYCRVLRFQRALRRVSAGTASWLDVALAAGYSDQAHFNREFRKFVGVTPTEYRQVAPRFPNHVPVGAVRR
jgi:AraC-like DNA-binding protein